MSTYAIPNRRPHHSPFLPLVLLAVLLAVAMVTTVHALTAHLEGPEISQCASDPANWLQVWLNSSGDRYNCLVRLGDGRIGDAVRQFSCRRDVWIEVSNYTLDGS